jgi:hypothetical protein
MNAMNAMNAMNERRVTLELPAVEPEALSAAPEGPARRVTLELPAVGTAPVEEQILRILRAPQRPREPVEAVFARRERELAAVFEALDPAESSELFRRLTRPRTSDPVAMSFARMIPERRGRLLASLVAAPRPKSA